MVGTNNGSNCVVHNYSMIECEFSSVNEKCDEMCVERTNVSMDQGGKDQALSKSQGFKINVTR